MAIYLSDNELEALYGLPMLAFRAYVAAIRPRMDIRTGYVGRIARISYQALCEWAYVEPVPGVQRESISHDQMYRACRVLERAGLLRICSERATKTLIFQCPKASLLSHAQNQAATRPRLEAATNNPSEINDLLQEAATDENSQAAMHRSEVYTLFSVDKSSSSTAAVGSPPPVGGEDEPPVNRPPQGGADGPQGANAVPLDVQPSFALETPVKSAAEKGVDFWPSGLDKGQRQAIAAKLSRVDKDRRQTVVDELSGFMRRNGKPIENPVRYVDFIIAKASLPVWFPEYAGSVRAAREQAAAVRRQVSAPPPPSGPRAAPTAEFLEAARKLRRSQP